MSKSTEKDMENLAFQLYRYLCDKDLAGDLRIYYKGGHCISSDEYGGGKVHFEKRVHKFNGKEYEYYYCMDEIKGSTYFEYSNDDTLSVSTEGGLCSVLNYYTDSAYCDKINEDLNKMFEEYGFYFEQGHHWNFSLYEI